MIKKVCENSKFVVSICWIGRVDKINEIYVSYVLAGPTSSTFASPPPGSPSSPSGTTRNSMKIFSLKIIFDFYESYTETSKA